MRIKTLPEVVRKATALLLALVLANSAVALPAAQPFSSVEIVPSMRFGEEALISRGVFYTQRVLQIPEARLLLPAIVLMLHHWAPHFFVNGSGTPVLLALGMTPWSGNELGVGYGQLDIKFGEGMADRLVALRKIHAWPESESRLSVFAQDYIKLRPLKTVYEDEAATPDELARLETEFRLAHAKDLVLRVRDAHANANDVQLLLNQIDQFGILEYLFEAMVGRMTLPDLINGYIATTKILRRTDPDLIHVIDADENASRKRVQNAFATVKAQPTLDQQKKQRAGNYSLNVQFLTSLFGDVELELTRPEQEILRRSRPTPFAHFITQARLRKLAVDSAPTAIALYHAMERSAATVGLPIDEQTPVHAQLVSDFLMDISAILPIPGADKSERTKWRAMGNEETGPAMNDHELEYVSRYMKSYTVGAVSAFTRIKPLLPPGETKNPSLAMRRLGVRYFRGRWKEIVQFAAGLEKTAIAAKDDALALQNKALDAMDAGNTAVAGDQWTAALEKIKVAEKGFQRLRVWPYAESTQASVTATSDIDQTIIPMLEQCLSLCEDLAPTPDDLHYVRPGEKQVISISQARIRLGHLLTADQVQELKKVSFSMQLRRRFVKRIKNILNSPPGNTDLRRLYETIKNPMSIALSDPWIAEHYGAALVEFILPLSESPLYREELRQALFPDTETMNDAYRRATSLDPLLGAFHSRVHGLLQQDVEKVSAQEFEETLPRLDSEQRVLVGAVEALIDDEQGGLPSFLERYSQIYGRTQTLKTSYDALNQRSSADDHPRWANHIDQALRNIENLLSVSDMARQEVLENLISERWTELSDSQPIRSHHHAALAEKVATRLLSEATLQPLVSALGSRELNKSVYAAIHRVLERHHATHPLVENDIEPEVSHPEAEEEAPLTPTPESPAPMREFAFSDLKTDLPSPPPSDDWRVPEVIRAAPTVLTVPYNLPTADVISMTLLTAKDRQGQHLLNTDDIVHAHVESLYALLAARPSVSVLRQEIRKMFPYIAERNAAVLSGQLVRIIIPKEEPAPLSWSLLHEIRSLWPIYLDHYQRIFVERHHTIHSYYRYLRNQIAAAIPPAAHGKPIVISLPDVRYLAALPADIYDGDLFPMVVILAPNGAPVLEAVEKILASISRRAPLQRTPSFRFIERDISQFSDYALQNLAHVIEDIPDIPSAFAKLTDFFEKQTPYLIDYLAPAGLDEALSPVKAGMTISLDIMPTVLAVNQLAIERLLARRFPDAYPFGLPSTPMQSLFVRPGNEDRAANAYYDSIRYLGALILRLHLGLLMSCTDAGGSVFVASPTPGQLLSSERNPHSRLAVENKIRMDPWFMKWLDIHYNVMKHYAPRNRGPVEVQVLSWPNVKSGLVQASHFYTFPPKPIEIRTVPGAWGFWELPMKKLREVRELIEAGDDGAARLVLDDVRDMVDVDDMAASPSPEARAVMTQLEDLERLLYVQVDFGNADGIRILQFPKQNTPEPGNALGPLTASAVGGTPAGRWNRVKDNRFLNVIHQSLDAAARKLTLEEGLTVTPFTLDLEITKINDVFLDMHMTEAEWIFGFFPILFDYLLRKSAGEEHRIITIRSWEASRRHYLTLDSTGPRIKMEWWKKVKDLVRVHHGEISQGRFWKDGPFLLVFPNPPPKPLSQSA